MSYSEESPAIDHIRDHVRYTLATKGISATERIVANLTVEAAAAQEFAGIAAKVEKEDISLSPSDWDELLDVADFLDGLTADSKLANERLRVAWHLLEAAKKAR